MSRILIVANDVVASRMAGPGIRNFELAGQLSRAGHEVTLAAGGAADLSVPAITLVPRPPPAEMHDLAGEHDVIIVQGLALRAYPSLRTLQAPLVVDLYDPFPLSLLEQEKQLPDRERAAHSSRIRDILDEQLLSGDFFVCASERQRDLWIGALMAVGRVNPRTWSADDSLRSLIDVVPFGLPESPPIPSGTRPEGFPANIGENDVVMIWGGGIYNWFDPLTLIRAVAKVSSQAPHLKLVFMSTDHPNPGIPPQMWMPRLARRLATELGVEGTQVFFNDTWIHYEQRADWLLSADIGVSTHFDHAETRYAFRTRILDYLWAGLPIVTTEGDVLAEVVKERGLGWTVPAGEIDPLAEVLMELVKQKATRTEMRARVRAVAAEMTWAKAAVPLLRFCARPAPAADDPRASFREGSRPSAITLRSQRSRQLLYRGFTSLREQGVAATIRQASSVLRRRQR